MSPVQILARIARLARVLDTGYRNGAFTPSSDIPDIAPRIDYASRNNRANYNDAVTRILEVR